MCWYCCVFLQLTIYCEVGIDLLIYLLAGKRISDFSKMLNSSKRGLFHQSCCLILSIFPHISAFCGLLLDGVSLGQRGTDRADRGQVHGSPEDRAARLVPEHGRRRDVAEQHLSQKGSKVGGSNSCPLGWVSAGSPKITGTHTHTHKQQSEHRCSITFVN